MLHTLSETLKQNSSEMPREVYDIIADLSIISGIPTGSKLNVSRGTYVPADSIWGSVIRTWYQERRESTVDHINTVISRACDIGSRYPTWREIIAKSVAGLEGALTNLSHTYHDDARIVGKLKPLYIKIQYKAFMDACSTGPGPGAVNLESTAPASQPIPITPNNSTNLSKETSSKSAFSVYESATDTPPTPERDRPTS